MDTRTIRRMERIFKGVANHRRIAILLLIERSPGITLEDIAGTLKCNLKTISEHVRRLSAAGLVEKEYQGRSVAHTLSPYGIKIFKIITTF